MAEFDEISVMRGFVETIAPLLTDKLGVLKSPDGTESTEPAIYLGGNFVPESTLPRVIVNYQGSDPTFVTHVETSIEDNPDYDENDEESQEFLYYITRYYHTNYILSLTADSGDTKEVLMGNRDSAAKILREIRKYLQRQSVRTSIHENMLSGVDSVMPETPVRSLDGTSRTDGANLLINFTYCDEDKELVGGTIDEVNISVEVYRGTEDEDPFTSNYTVVNE